MKKQLYFVFFFLAACGVPQEKFDSLQKEEEALKEQLQVLQSQVHEMRKGQVTFANTTTRTIKSNYNGQNYLLKVQFPKGYHQEKVNYPVLYVLDAETNFGGVGYIVQRLIKDRLIPKVLLVGIAYNTDYKTFYKLRSRDLTPTEDKNLKMGGAKVADPTGGAPLFCQFLENELFPFIAKEFRVKEGERAIYGHSYGGLFGSYAFLEHTDMFNKYLILSPSLWFQNNQLLDDVKQFKMLDSKVRVYMGSGELERRIDDLQTDFANQLKAKQLPKLILKAEVFENETHRTIFGTGFTNGLRFLYAE